MTTPPFPQDTRQSDTRHYLFAGVVLMWAIFFLSGIFSLPLMPPDEPKYAFAAAKMLETGDFITPTFNCAPRFDKPPLIYWCIAASYKIFGVSDWAARVPSLLATLGLILLVYRMCRRTLDDRTAYLSVIVFATLLHVWFMGRAVAPEMLLVFFETAAIFSFSRGLEQGTRWHIRFGYVFTALAVVTKGPVGLIIPCGIVLPYFSVKKGVRHTAKRFLDPAGIILFLLIGLPWYALMLRIHGQKYFEEFFLLHNVYRFTGKARQHPFRFYYYLPILLGSLYLWLPFSRHIWLHIKKCMRDRSEELFFLYWAAFVLLFFTIASNKLHNYILIAYPPVAVLIGSSVRHIVQPGRSVRNIAAGMAAVEIAALAYGARYLTTLPLSVALGGAGVLCMTLLFIARPHEVERALLLVVAKGLTLLFTMVLFLAHHNQQMKLASALVLLEVMFEKDPIYFYQDESEDIVFYADRCISTLHSREELEEVRQQHDEFVLLVREKHLDDLKGIQAELTVPFQDIRGRRRYLMEITRRGPG